MKLKLNQLLATIFIIGVTLVSCQSTTPAKERTYCTSKINGMTSISTELIVYEDVNINKKGVFKTSISMDKGKLLPIYQIKECNRVYYLSENMLILNHKTKVKGGIVLSVDSVKQKPQIWYISYELSSFNYGETKNYINFSDEIKFKIKSRHSSESEMYWNIQ